MSPIQYECKSIIDFKGNLAVFNLMRYNIYNSKFGGFEMRKYLLVLLLIFSIYSMAADEAKLNDLISAHKNERIEFPEDFVLVEGGTFKNTNSNYYDKNVTVSSFYISKFEVTQKEWETVMGSNPSYFKGDNLPVEQVSWYDCIEYCNKRSIKEGLTPYYNIDKSKKDPNNKNDYDDIKWIVTINGGNGYRLPTEAEWEYAAGGGQSSKSYTYSGSDSVGEVAMYNKISTKPVGDKKANELWLYDMSGNVWEWAQDWYGDLESNRADPKGSLSGSNRVISGGSWDYLGNYCEVSYRDGDYPDSGSTYIGFRVVRSLSR